MAATRPGARTALLAGVGDDDARPAGRRLVRAAGVDTDALLSGDAPTGVALITVDPGGDNSIVVSPGANARLSPEGIGAAGTLFARARAPSLQLEIPLGAVRAGVAAVEASRGRLVLNPWPPGPLPREVPAAWDPLASTGTKPVPGSAVDPPRTLPYILTEPVSRTRGGFARTVRNMTDRPLNDEVLAELGDDRIQEIAGLLHTDTDAARNVVSGSVASLTGVLTDDSLTPGGTAELCQAIAQAAVEPSRGRERSRVGAVWSPGCWKRRPNRRRGRWHGSRDCRWRRWPGPWRSSSR